MHAYLYIGQDIGAVDSKIKAFVEKSKGRLLEFPMAKIENTRELSKFLSYSQSETLFIYLKNVDYATPESLNAFLKNLEEPNVNVNFILTAGNEHKVLPTIASRCLIIRVTGRKPVTEIDKNAVNFDKLGIGEKILIIDKIKKKADALEFIKNLIFNLHGNLVKENSPSKKAMTLKMAQETLNSLNSNGNVGLHLANFVIRIY